MKGLGLPLAAPVLIIVAGLILGIDQMFVFGAVFTGLILFTAWLRNQ